MDYRCEQAPSLPLGPPFNLKICYLAISARVWTFLVVTNLSFITNELHILRNLALPEVQNTLSSIYFYHFSFKRSWISTLFSIFRISIGHFVKSGELSTQNIAEKAGRALVIRLTQRAAVGKRISARIRAGACFCTQQCFVDICCSWDRDVSSQVVKSSRYFQKCQKVPLFDFYHYLAEVGR